MTDEVELAIGIKLAKNRVLAHQTLFKHRHPNRTPAFHKTLITSWYSPARHLLWLVFRGGAKSTIAEEGIIIKAGFREFRNCIIVSDILDRAAERLTAIKTEIEGNELLATVFGDLKGSVWGYDEVVLSNGRRILAMGRGQSIRGIKFNDMRPDFVFADDLEDEESVATPQARAKTRRWFMKELLPALDPGYRVRMAATPLDRESLPMELAKSGEEGFKTLIFPVEHTGDHGERLATWEDRFPLSAIDKIRENYRGMGMTAEFNMEYMCKADDPSDRVFKSDYIRVEPQVRTWQNTYAFFDPARSLSSTAATTGLAVWSWMSGRLIVWEAWGKKLLPDELVDAIFQIDAAYKPALIGVEEDGLNEWLMQPIRKRMAELGRIVPVIPVKAPVGKIDFIKALQVFYQAKEVIHAKDLPDLRNQLLGFPSGHIDVPNALAYALKLRQGLPVYEGFGPRHIATDLVVMRESPVYLALNASGSMLSAVLCQLVDGCLRVYADWIKEGEPAIELQRIAGEASAEVGKRVRMVAGPQHFERYTNIGLVQAGRLLVDEVRKGVEPTSARPFIQTLLERDRRGIAAVRVNESARFTMNAFAGAYARKLGASGMLEKVPEDNLYRLLMEGLESAAGLFNIRPDDEESERHYDFTRKGERYVSLRR